MQKESWSENLGNFDTHGRTGFEDVDMIHLDFVGFSGRLLL